MIYAKKLTGRSHMVFIHLFLVCTVSWGQSSIDLFTLSGLYGFPTSYDQPLAGKAAEYGALSNLKAPIRFNDKTIWFNDLTYMFHRVTTDLSPEPATFLTSMNLHAFIFQTGLVRKLDDRNAIQMLLVPRYNSDFNGNDPKNWQLGGIGLFEHRYHERLLMRFGALYNQELFGPLLVPLVYLDWRWNERWSMTGLVPINLKISYQINNRFVAGFSHFGFITTYRIGQSEFQSDYVERNSIDEALFARWRIAGNLHVETRFGYSLARVYEQYSEDQKMDFRLSIIRFGDSRLQKNVNFDSGPIASIRLMYSLPLINP